MQGHTQTEAISKCFDIEEVKVYDVYREAAEKYAEDMRSVVSGRIVICDSPEEAADADALITVTQAKEPFLTADMVKPGAVVIDVGINRVDGKVKGDVDFDAVKEVAGWITPVPGGVGKMTITMLLANTVEAAERTVAK